MPDGSELSEMPLGYGVPEGAVVVVTGATVVVVTGATVVVVTGGAVVVVGGRSVVVVTGAKAVVTEVVGVLAVDAMVVVGDKVVVATGGAVVVGVGARTGDELPQCHLFDQFANCEFVVNVLIIAELLRTVLAPEFVDAPTS